MKVYEISSCLCIPCQPLNARTTFYETWCAYHGTSTHLIGLLLSAVARQQLGKHVPATKNASKDRRPDGRVIFSAVRVLT
jgi:hypothetical protein